MELEALASPPPRQLASPAVIARVEPLTTTRRLAGPFDYALPDAPGRGRLDRARAVRAPGARRRRGRARRDAPRCRRRSSSRRPAVREDIVPAELVELALWMADEYCSTPARALSLVLPPQGRPRTELWAARTERAAGRRAADRAASARCSTALPRAAGGDLAALRRLEARGLVAIAARGRAGARRSPSPHADRAVHAHRRAGGRASPRSGAAARTCCTASPARARPRSTCARPPRRSSAARA